MLLLTAEGREDSFVEAVGAGILFGIFVKASKNYHLRARGQCTHSVSHHQLVRAEVSLMKENVRWYKGVHASGCQRVG